MTRLERRIIDISYHHKLAHIGSCLTAIGIIEEIFKLKKPDEKFVLSCGHAGLALYAMLEELGLADAEDLLLKCGIHPDRKVAENVIDCSTGSLGQGLPIALGMALSDRSKNVYCLVSDGECAEGSIYEAMNLRQKYSLNNLKVYCNHNGWAAYDKTTFKFFDGMQIRDTQDNFFIQQWSQEAHYRVLTDKDYAKIIC
jgi:transketolase